jgi:hypothetical protein
MIILDFLFYYLTLYYTEHKDRLIWSTPLEWTTYVVGTITLLWIISICEAVELLIIKTLKFPPELPFLVTGVIIALAIMQFYKYIYFTRDRLKFIHSTDFKSLRSIKSGKSLAIGFVVFSFIIPFAIFMVFT